jgi:hypothetical protein
MIAASMTFAVGVLLAFAAYYYFRQNKERSSPPLKPTQEVENATSETEFSDGYNNEDHIHCHNFPPIQLDKSLKNNTSS